MSVVWMLLKRNIKFWIYIGIILFVVLLAVVGPLVARYGPQEPVKLVYVVNASEIDAVVAKLRSEYNLKPGDITVKDYRFTYTGNETEAYAYAEKCRNEGYTARVFTITVGNKTIYTAVCEDPNKKIVEASLRSLPPSPSFIFGIDKQGYDVFSSTVYGLRVSLAVGAIAAVIATLVGTLLGLVAGYMGGWIDAIIDGFTNMLIAIPTIFLMLIIGLFYVVGGGAVGREVQNIVFLGLTVGLLSWPWTARAVRAQVQALKASDYITVSILSGNSHLRVIVKDVLPNIASYVLLVFVIQLANALGTAVTLEFLGIKAAEWSLFARINQYLMLGEHWSGGWWSIFIPGAIIVALIASLYLMVLVLDEVFNPRLRKV